MCVNRTYSRYQRTVIDLLNKQLGDRPFSYEKAQNNHLKVLIEGVSRPIYTGSTPSDVKSGKNFMAEVNREIRKAREEALIEETERATSASTDTPACLYEKYAKLIRNIAKNLRQLRQSLMHKEWKLVEEAQNTEVLTTHRKTLRDTVIKTALATRKSEEYVTSSEMRYIENEVNKHLEFILPNTAYYAEKLSPKSVTEITPLHSASNANTKKNKKIKAQTQETSVLNSIQSKVPEVAFPPLEMPVIDTAPPRPLDDLMQQPSKARVQGFKELTQSQMQALIDDLMAAKALKRQEDIALILQLMEEKEISLTDLQTPNSLQPHAAA